MDIAEFLAARLDEDERMARAASARHSGTWAASDGEVFSHIGLDSPTRCPDHPAGQPNYCDDVRVVVVDDDLGGDDTEDAAVGEHVARHDPVRAIADAAAKRAILAEHEPHEVIDGYRGDGTPQRRAACRTCVEFYDDEDSGGNWNRNNEHADYPCDTVRALASAYADHPDVDPSWRLSSSGTSAGR